MTKPVSRYVHRNGEPSLHYFDWGGDGQELILLHGLASNARIWDLVAPILAERFRVVALDQRGHGRSEPADDYGFEAVAQDVEDVADLLCFDRPVVVGHSWGGNVALQYAATRRPPPTGLVLVDGGFLDLRIDPERTWDEVAADLAPPNLAGLSTDELRGQIREWTNGYWSEPVQDAVLANFHADECGTIRPHLDRSDHLAILRALWEQRPAALYPDVVSPTLVVVAEQWQERRPGWGDRRARMIAAVESGLPNARVVRFADTVHDVPLQRPAELAEQIARFAASLAAGG
ncbi:MAG: alpha/beta hydrolase [Chloroflexi bacterium]|nr:alpha/beta hydrolase [Chloroflexota bacterium]